MVDTPQQEAANLHRHSSHGGARSSGDHRSQLKKGLKYGVVSGLAAIMCCVSPVVFALLGVATAAQAVALGDTLYYGYGWAFRAAGLAVGAVAVVLYLRGRRSCTIHGARHYWRMLIALVAAGGTTYVALFWFTKFLGIWFT